jgi:hypothetical protein
MGDDAARLLAAMLQGVQAEGDEIRRVRGTDDAENATFFLEFIIVKRMGQKGRGLREFCVSFAGFYDRRF